MRDYVAETSVGPRLRAWLVPDDPNDDIDDPTILRSDGWRLIIEKIDGSVQDEPIRSAWEPKIEDVIRHMEYYWKEKPAWKVHQSGEYVDLYSLLGLEFRPVGKENSI